jgi:phospho-N-acetylmuramoyl-pentapeptide-transferase
MEFPLTLGSISFFIAVVWGRPLISLLKRWGIGKQIRIEGPDRHQVKTGTPTMGGILFVLPVLLITGVLNLADLLGFNLIGQSTLLLFFCLAAYATLGAVDDWQGIKGIRGRGEGMSARMKSSFQFIFAAIIASVLYFGPPELDYVGVPGIPNFVELGWLFLPIAVFVIVAASNAVNLTDGLESGGEFEQYLFCQLWHYCLFAAADLPGRFLFHNCGRALRLSLVQRPPGGTLHGRCWQPGAGGHTGIGLVDDGAMAAAPHCGAGLLGRDALGNVTGRFGEIQPTLPRSRHTLVQNGPAPPPF